MDWRRKLWEQQKVLLGRQEVKKKDLYLYLLNYRNSPVAGLHWSLAQLLQNRELRITSNCLNKKPFKPIVVDGNLKKEMKNYSRRNGMIKQLVLQKNNSNK